MKITELQIEGLKKKLGALSQIPRGNVNDAFFEKLYDELSSWCTLSWPYHEKLVHILKCGIVDCLEIAINQQSTELRSLANGILAKLSCLSELIHWDEGHCSVDYPSVNKELVTENWLKAKNLVLLLIQKYEKYLEQPDQLDGIQDSSTNQKTPNEQFTLLQIAECWLSELSCLISDHYERLIVNGLCSRSLKVQRAAVNLASSFFLNLKSLEQELGFIRLVEKLANSGKIMEPECVCLSFILNISLDESNTGKTTRALEWSEVFRRLIWHGIATDSCQVAENARTLFRRILEIGCIKLLVNDQEPSGRVNMNLKSVFMQHIIDKLNMLIKRLIKSGELNKIVQGMTILNVGLVDETINEHCSKLYLWRQDKLNEMYAVLAKSINFKLESQIFDTEMVKILSNHWSVYFEAYLNIILSNPHSKMDKAAPIRAKNVLNICEVKQNELFCVPWRVHLKLFKFWKDSWILLLDSWEIFCNYQLTILRSSSYGLALKLRCFEVIRNIAENPTCYDQQIIDDPLWPFAEEIVKSFLSPYWELRDSGMHIILRLIMHCPDHALAKWVDVGILNFVNFNLKDESYYLRADSLMILSKIQKSTTCWNHFKSLQQEEIVKTIFSVRDCEDVARQAQAIMIASWLCSEEALVLLKQYEVLDSQDFCNLIIQLSEDHDWEVRKHSMKIIYTLNENRLTEKIWYSINGLVLLVTAVNDSSRLVRLSACKKIKKIVEKDCHQALVLSSECFEGSGLIDEVEKLIAENSDPTLTYDTEDEIYPSQNITSNQIDCPF